MKKIITSQYENNVQNIKTLPAHIKNQSHDALTNFNQQYFQEIPIQNITKNLQELGLGLINEDGTPFAGFLTGEEGRADIDLTWMGSPVNNALTITWYKMPSGNYEIVTYIG